MLYPHITEVSCRRTPVEGDFNLKAAIKRADSFHTFYAKKALFHLLKSSPADSVRAKKAAKKLKSLDVDDARRGALNDFLELWNKWRGFYFPNVRPVTIKSKAQITTIENYMQEIKDKGLDLNIAMACVHRAFVRRKFRPSFNDLRYAEEHMERFAGQVNTDEAVDDYEDRSLTK